MVVLLTGLLGAVSMAALAGARRTESAYGRYLQSIRASDVMDTPIAQDAHFVGTASLDLYGNFPFYFHDALPRRAARSTAALRNDGVENVAALTLV